MWLGMTGALYHMAGSQSSQLGTFTVSIFKGKLVIECNIMLTQRLEHWVWRC